MSQCLLTGGFKWLSDKKVQQINLAMYTNKSAKGFILILEVDLEYPSSLHKLNNDHPLAAEKLKVTEEMLSRYWVTIRKKYKISIGHVLKETNPNTEQQRKICIPLQKSATVFGSEIKTKEGALRIGIPPIAMAKTVH